MLAFVTIKERSKNLLVYGGITAMTGAAMLGVGGSVFAQEASTPAAGTEEADDATDATSEQSTREQAYADFLDALAVNLGVADGATVDAAIKTTQKQLIDERLAAGEISADLATELKAAIDSGEYPVRFHLPGMDSDRGPGGRGHSHDGVSRGSVGGGDANDPDTSDDASTDEGGTADDAIVPATGTPTAGSGLTG